MSRSYCSAVTMPQDPSQYGGQPQYPQQTPYPQSGPMPQYPQQPGYNPYAAPQVPAHEMHGPRRPATVETAFWISVVVPLVVTVLTVVSFMLVQGFTEDVINATARDSGIQDGQMMSDIASATRAAMMVVYIIVTVFYLVLTGLWILFGFKLRAGRGWARVTLTVFAALWVLNALTGLINGGMTAGTMPEGIEVPGSMLALSYAANGIGLVAMAAFIVLVFLKPSNHYFQAAAYRR